MRVLFPCGVFLLYLPVYLVSSFDDVSLPISSWIEIGKCLPTCHPIESKTMCYIRCLAEHRPKHDTVLGFFLQRILPEDPNLDWHFPEPVKVSKDGKEMKLTYVYPVQREDQFGSYIASSLKLATAFLLLKKDSTRVLKNSGQK